MKEEIGLEGFLGEINELDPENLIVYGSLANGEHSKVSDENFIVTFNELKVEKLRKLRKINKKYKYDLFPLRTDFLRKLQDFIISPIFVKQFNKHSFPLIGEKIRLGNPTKEKIRENALYFFKVSRLPIRFIISQHPSWLEDEEMIKQVVRYLDWSLFGRVRGYLSYKGEVPTSRKNMIRRLKEEGRETRVYEELLKLRENPEEALGRKKFLKKCLKELDRFELLKKKEVKFEKPGTICQAKHPLEELEKKDWVKSIIWYGSRAVGECREESDYDYIVAADELDYKKLKYMGQICESFEEKEGAPISILPYTLEELKETGKEEVRRGSRIGKLRFYKHSAYSLKRTYKVMHGYDILRGIELSKKEIREDARKEFILLKLKMLKKFVKNVETRTMIKNCIWMARDYLFLKGNFAVTKEEIMEGLKKENKEKYEELRRIRNEEEDTAERCLKFAIDFEF